MVGFGNGNSVSLRLRVVEGGRRGVGERAIIMLSFNNRCGRLITEHIERYGMCYRVCSCGASLRGVGTVGPGKVVLANNPGDYCRTSSPAYGGRLFRLNVPILKLYCNTRLVVRILNKGIRGTSIDRCKGARILMSGASSGVFGSMSSGAVY